MGGATRRNDALRRLMIDAGLTGVALAEEIDKAGRESGAVLRYDRTAVAHWLRGTQPRPPTPELIAEILARHLGRPVTTAEAGFGERTTSIPTRPSPPTDDVHSTLIQLMHASTPTTAPARARARRTAAADGVYSLLALSLPSWNGVSRDPRVPPTAAVCGRTGRAEIDCATEMAALFCRTDTAFGGGLARQAIAGYLAATISPWIQRASGHSARAGLLAVASRLCYLAGFMCFDDNRHTDAQRYYLTCLRLAAQADDPDAYAVGLRALSVQALALGHRRHAVDLAEAALSSLSAIAPERMRAFVYGHLAVAHAAVGERRTAICALTLAERHLDRAEPISAASGSFHPSALAHCRSAVFQALADRPRAVRALKVSLNLRPELERRSRAITRARLAELQLTTGHLDEACATWHRFCDDYPHLSCGRADTAMKNLWALTRPYQRNPVAATLRSRAATLTRPRP